MSHSRKSMTFEMVSSLHSEGMGWLYILTFEKCGMQLVIILINIFVFGS